MPALKRFAVVGQPIAHSRSPQIFAALAELTGVALAYGRLEIAPDEFDERLAAARTEYDGWNVTAPHKARAREAADVVSEEAELVGAANVITFRAGRALATNTDVEGVVALVQSCGADPRGEVATVLGAGGAARATVLGLARLGARRIVVANRTPEHARELCAALATATGESELCPGPPEANSVLVINATSDGNAVREAVRLCAPEGWCVDLQYRSEATPFVAAARAAGRQAVDGTTMLIAQALATFRHWIGGVELDLAAVEARLRDVVQAPSPTESMFQ